MQEIFDKLLMLALKECRRKSLHSAPYNLRYETTIKCQLIGKFCSCMVQQDIGSYSKFDAWSCNASNEFAVDEKVAFQKLQSNVMNNLS